MIQLLIPSLQIDILASSLRVEKHRLEALIRDLEDQELAADCLIQRIKELERGIKRLRRAA